MEKIKDNMTDNEIRILGMPEETMGAAPPPRRPLRWLWIVLLLVAVAAVTALCITRCGGKATDKTTEAADTIKEVVTNVAVEKETPRVICRDTTVNDIPLQLFTPRGCHVELYVGSIPKDNDSVMLAVNAADVRTDVGQPAGDFIYKGEVLSKGHSKYGYCSIIGDEVTLGNGLETPLLNKAIEAKGSFFRQYSLVSNSKIINVPPKGKKLRKALCLCEGRLTVVCTKDEESFHDFSEALIDMGITEAISLVGSAGIIAWRTDDGKLTSNHELRRWNVPSENYLLFVK